MTFVVARERRNGRETAVKRGGRPKNMRPPSSSVFPPLRYIISGKGAAQVDNYERESERASCRTACCMPPSLQLMSRDFMTLFSHSGRSSKEGAESSSPPSSFLLLRSLLLTKTRGEIHLRLAASCTGQFYIFAGR